MDNAMLAILVTVGLCAVSVAGDYLLKRASDHAPSFASWWFVAGLVLYSSTAFGWVFVMRRLTFATLGAVYAIATVLLLTLVGVLFLRESLRWQEVVGVGLAVTAVGLLARFA
jgi:drug/metabolite transporter (DMT)-like permease